MRTTLFAIAMLAALSACTGTRIEVALSVDGTADGAAKDSGSLDDDVATAADASATESDGGSDATKTDADTTDAGSTDVVTADTGTNDTGTNDAGTTDAGTTDAGTMDTGTTDTGTTDAATSDASSGDADDNDTTVGAGSTVDGSNGSDGSVNADGASVADGGADVSADTDVVFCGKVTDAKSGKPLAGATVTLSGDNGAVLASVTTDANGKYCLPKMAPLTAKTWTLTAVAPAYDPQTKGPIAAAGGKVTSVDFTLKPSVKKACVTANFEAGSSAWTASAVVDGAGWQVRDGGNVLVNSAAGKCVNIPPDESCKPSGKPLDPCPICFDAAATGCLPKAGALPRAFEGKRYAWFGNPKTGNYLGNLNKCVVGNGGKTAQVIVGTYTSPKLAIAKSATEMRVMFRHWFEVESQSPGALHDKMQVQASADGKTFMTLGTLTPITLQAGSPGKGQTSAGLFTAPRWVLVSLPVPAVLANQVKTTGFITLRLSFDTADKELNGFRGWAVDELQIVASGC